MTIPTLVLGLSLVGLLFLIEHVVLAWWFDRKRRAENTQWWQAWLMSDQPGAKRLRKHRNRADDGDAA